MYAQDKVDNRRAPLLTADETGGGGADYQAIEKQQQAPKRGCRDPVSARQESSASQCLSSTGEGQIPQLTRCLVLQVFLLLFLVNLGLVVWVAVTYGLDSLKAQSHGGTAADEKEQPEKNRNMLVGRRRRTIMLRPEQVRRQGGRALTRCFFWQVAGVILAVLAGVLSGGWMTFMIRHASDLIRCMLWTVIIANIAAAALGLAAGQVGRSRARAILDRFAGSTD